MTVALLGCPGGGGDDPPPPSEDLVFDFSFLEGPKGWTGGHADYPAGQEGLFGLAFDLRAVPHELGPGSALHLSGNNHSDDLFMFMKRRVTGLSPDRAYRVHFAVRLASNAVDGSIGIGGSPANGVFLKAGATRMEPIASPGASGYLRMNVDKGNQSGEGREAVVLGDIAKRGSDDSYEWIERNNADRPFCFTADSSGEAWILLGTDSGFEGATSLYYRRITVRFEPLGRPTGLPTGIEYFPDVPYGRIEGTSLLLDVYRSREAPPSVQPAILFAHPGGWRRGSKAQARDYAAELVPRGFVVFSIDYRLVPDHLFPSQVEDALTSVRFVRRFAARFGVDPDRIGFMGASAGGYLASMAALAGTAAGFQETGGHEGVSSRVQAACVVSGPSDLQGPTNFYGRFLIRSFLGGRPSEIPKVYKFASPVTHVSSDDPPIFLVHGKEDRLVPVVQAERLYGKLRRAGVDAEILLIDHMGHGIPVGGIPSPPRPEWIRAIADFFRRRLKAA